VTARTAPNDLVAPCRARTGGPGGSGGVPGGSAGVAAARAGSAGDAAGVVGGAGGSVAGDSVAGDDAWGPGVLGKGIPPSWPSPAVTARSPLVCGGGRPGPAAGQRGGAWRRMCY